MAETHDLITSLDSDAKPVLEQTLSMGKVKEAML